MYLTRDEFFEITGYNLSLEIAKSDDPVKDPERFIDRIENKIISYLLSNYNFSKSQINEKTLPNFKKAIAEQCYYETYMGRDADLGKNTFMYLNLCGFLRLECF